MSVLQTDLFPEFDAGLGRACNAGCATPIGRRTGSRRRRVLRSRPRRPSTAAVLSEIRAMLQHEFGGLVLQLRTIERQVGGQGERRSADSELLDRILGRLMAIERAVGICEQPQAPRPTRARAQ